MHPVIPYVIAALLFGIGVYGVLRRRNAIMVLMAIELMLNAVNLIFVIGDATARDRALPALGQVFTLFVIVLAAAEVGVGLAIVLQLFRLKGSVIVDYVALSHVEDELADTDEDTDVDGPAFAARALERAADDEPVTP
jgi:NADH-quinone oxidoreductase subunit K